MEIQLLQMTALRKKLGTSPAMARAVPFLIFVGLTFLQGEFSEAGRYWIYLIKTLLGVWMIWLMRPLVKEMKWAVSWEAVIVGIGVFLLWVGLDGFYPSLGQLFEKLGFSKASAQLAWNPHNEFGYNSARAWMFIVVRIVGSALVVPPLEEVFYRSFLYRWIVKPDFQNVALNHFAPKAFFGTALMFGLAHHEWLAGILCGLAYQWLVLRKNRLGDAMTAHAITNFLLGVAVVWKGAWHFW